MNVAAYIISYKTDFESKSCEKKIQQEKIENFCKKNGLNIIKWYVEPDESRSDFKPKLVELMNEAPKKKFIGVIVYKFDRFALEEDIKKWVIDEFNKYHINIYSVMESTITRSSIESAEKINSIKQKVKDLPSLPEVVIKVTELVQNPKSSATDLGEIISQDSGLTSRVLRLVNSAYYGFPKQISSVRHAIMVLGFTTIKGLVLSSSIFKIFAPKDKLMVGLDYKKFWKHSLLTAIASKRIYNELFFEDDENIFSAAILHDIGKLILDQYDHENYIKVMADAPDQIYGNQVLIAEQKHCELTHPAIGTVVAEGWNLPEFLCEVIKFHHTPLKSKKYEKIATVVYLGNIISQLVLDFDEFNMEVFDEEITDHIGVDENDLLKIFEIVKEETFEIKDIESFFK